MVQHSTAGRLLQRLNEDSPATRDAVVHAAGVATERSDAAAIGALRLSLSEQLRLAEATAALAPKFRRDALRLRAQVLAARSYEAQELVERHRETPAQRWEVSSSMQR